MPCRWKSGTMRLANKENMPLEFRIMPPKLEEALIQKTTQVS